MHVNEKTNAAPSSGPEDRTDAFRSATGRPERRTWRAEELRGADLRGQDLRGVEGLLPEHLAGAVLTGAILPDDIGKFEALGQVAAISSEARKVFIGLLAHGEGWHNNHHADPRSAKHGHKWWEFDTTWLTIRLFEKLGLATDLVGPSPYVMAKAGSTTGQTITTHGPDGTPTH